MNDFRAPGMSQILGVRLRWGQDKTRRTQNPKVQRERRSISSIEYNCRCGGGGNEVISDLIASCSRARGLAHRDPFQLSRAQDFQVPLSLQALTLGEYHLPSTTGGSASQPLGRLGFLFPSVPFRWGSPCWRPRSWWESTLTPMWLCVLGSSAE